MKSTVNTDVLSYFSVIEIETQQISRCHTTIYLCNGTIVSAVAAYINVHTK